jgi:Fe-S-cluster containining protein
MRATRPPREPPPVRCLSFHSEYLCANTGVCCSSAWDIAVEHPVELQLKSRLEQSDARLPNGPDGFQPLSDPPAGTASSFRLTPTGACWFLDTGAHRCAIHREFGEAALPSACRQFPRICVLEPQVVTLSLSHYCPTAAGLLFRPGGDFGIVEGRSGVSQGRDLEGLDARGSCSPFLRRGVLLGFDGLRQFEEGALSVLATHDLPNGLDRIQHAADQAALWKPDRGPLVSLIGAAFAEAPLMPRPPLASHDVPSTLLASLPQGALIPTGLPPASRAGLAVYSAQVDQALRRYVAARMIAGWMAFQADGLATFVRYLRLCVDTVLSFAAARDQKEPEIDRFKEAIRSTDLWIVHYCDPERLAANLK